MILKGAEETPSGAVHIVEALHQAGIPDGVVNLVFGVPGAYFAAPPEFPNREGLDFHELHGGWKTAGHARREQFAALRR
ncbi:aldehyde dehydrogenase family protein [Mesorhizobium sp.]|uniref:aldehyde dehydrogenase family protein n=1 Tax=Mesorhizobium sp. TaxID=1871066 RepID=UPI0025FB11EC|nr:aldehyde dehydrogenase family protein [Mesorhizobium sp.]